MLATPPRPPRSSSSQQQTTSGQGSHTETTRPSLLEEERQYVLNKPPVPPPQPSQSSPVSIVQTPPSQINPQTVNQLSGLRTFRQDVSRTTQERKLSAADIAIAEEARRRRGTQVTKERTSYFGTIILTILLLTVGGAALFVGYRALQPPENIVSQEKPRQPLVVTETQEEIEITGRSANDIREQLRQRLRSGDITIATIREYFFTTQQLVNNVPAKLYVGAPLFFSSLQTSMPAELLRNLADNFMYGIFSFDGNRGYFVVRPTSLTIAFKSMLEWEDNGLIRDILPLLTPVQITQDDIFAPFIDEVISNQDVRIARNPQGQEVLLYSLTSQNLLVIASDSETFREVVARLNTPAPLAR